MSSESNPSTSERGPSWPALGVHERRVVGVLVEKAMTTQDAGPLSMNSLVTGCNQKSNRDPLMTLDDIRAEEALVAAQKKGLVSRLMGSGRVERWKHNCYDAFHVSRVELGILAELLLRGPQTEGELRGRASRMEPIADVDALRGILRSLVERKLAVYLTPEGRRGTIVTHGFHAADELEHLRARQGAADARAASEGEAKAVATQTQAASAGEIGDLRTSLADLQKTVGRA